MATRNDQDPTPNEDETGARSVQFKLDGAVLDRLDAACARQVIGRQLVLQKAAEMMTEYLETLPNPLDGLTIGASKPRAASIATEPTA